MSSALSDASSGSPSSSEELLSSSAQHHDEEGNQRLIHGGFVSSSSSTSSSSSPSLGAASVGDGLSFNNSSGTQQSEAALSNCELFSLNSYIIGWSALWTCLYVVALPSKVLEIVRADNAAAGFAPSPSSSSALDMYGYLRNATSGSEAGAGGWVEGKCAADVDKGKGTSLSLVLLAGAPAQVFLPPLIGYISDHTYTRFGSRRPFVFVGIVLTIVCLIAIAFCDTLPALSLVWFLLQFSSNIGSNCFMAMLADVVPARQFGKGSGMMGALSCLGQFLGAAIGLLLKPLGFAGVYSLLIILHVFTSLPTLFLVQDQNARKRPPSRWQVDFTCFADASASSLSAVPSMLVRALCAVVKPFQHADFFWVFITRFLFNMGQYTIQEFLQYYVCDLIDTGDIPASEATSMLLMPMLFVALFAAYSGGVLSDRLGGRRKIFVYVSGAVMALSSIVSTFNRSFGITFMLCVFFGAAFGLFGSVDFALVCDVLPNEADRAKDMALWHIALVMPQFIAVPISGGILDTMNESHGPGPAYAVVFIIACCYFMLGAALVSKVKATK